MAHELNVLKVITHDSVSVGNGASVEILPANSRRLYAEIVNSSANGIWIKLGATAVVGEGIYLAPNGFSYEIKPDNMWRGAVNGIAVAGAANNVGTIEGQ